MLLPEFCQYQGAPLRDRSHQKEGERRELNLLFLALK